MACFMIGCHLGSPGNDYIALTDAIERIGKSFACTSNTWIVASELGASEIRDELRPHLGPNDGLLVAELSGKVAWRASNDTLSHGLRAILR